MRGLKVTTLQKKMHNKPPLAGNIFFVFFSIFNDNMLAVDM